MNYIFNGRYKYKFENEEVWTSFNGSIWNSSSELWEEIKINSETNLPDNLIDADRAYPFSVNPSIQDKMKITNNIEIKPEFKETTRYYTLTFIDGDGSILHQINDAQYGDNLEKIHIPSIPKTPYKADGEGFGLEDVYDCIGYSTSLDYKALITKDSTVGSDKTYYAWFEKTNIRNVIHPEWFQYDITVYDGNSGYLISPAKDKILRGKITIPSFYNNIPIHSIGGFGYSEEEISKHKITHIFMQENSNLMKITSRAFINCPELVYFDFSQNTVKNIEAKAFQKCGNLNLSLFNKLSNNLTQVGANAFNQALTANEAIILEIPPSLAKIGDAGFNYLKLPKGCQLSIGNQDQKSNLDLSAFTQQDQYLKFAQTQETMFANITFWSILYKSEDDIIYNKGTVQRKVADCFGSNRPTINIL